MVVRLNVPKLVTWLWRGVAALVVLGVGFQVLYRLTGGFFGLHDLARLTNLDGESNLPSTFSAGLLALAGVLLLAINRTRGRVGDTDRRLWLALSLLFFFLAVDEQVQLHETLVGPFQRLFKTGGLLRFAWVIPYGLAALALFVYTLPWLRTLPPATRRGMILAGVLYVAGSVGVEMVSGLASTAFEYGTLPVILLHGLEEGLEMSGVVVFLSTLLRHMLIALPGIRMEFSLHDDRPQDSAPR